MSDYTRKAMAEARHQIRNYRPRPAALAQSDAGPKQDVRYIADSLPPLPDDDADFTPQLARSIIAKYQKAIRILARPAASAGLIEAAEWEYRYRFENGSVGDWNPLTEKFITNIFSKSGFDVRIAPSRPDVSGLIEAAEWLDTAASQFNEAAEQMDRWAGDTRERAKLFRIRARAADRSGK